MSQKIKNILFYFVKLNRKTLFVLGSFLIVGFLLPLYQAQAIEWTEFLDPVRLALTLGSAFDLDQAGTFVMTSLANVITALFTTAYQLILLLSIGFLAIGVGMLNIVTHPNFITLSYTNPQTNALLGVGWTLIRDLANIAFVIALVVIGLATALRLEEYQARKTLPILILIALLINFTPVICGLIVDASNIVMNFFLGDGINFDIIPALLVNQGKLIINSWLPSNEWQAGPLIQTLFLTIFGFIAGFIFLIFSFLFQMRYVAIWMLVILSPLAFFCYILPSTRKIWSMWWNQFLQWCLIGVVASFFLYLGMHMADLARPGGEMLGVGFTESGETGQVAGMLNALMPYQLLLGFLLIGLFATLSISAMGAQQTMRLVQKGTMATGKWAARSGLGVARGIPIVGKTEEKIRKRLETAPVISKLFGETGAYERNRKAAMKKAGESFKDLPPDEIRKVLNSYPLTYDDRLRKAQALELLTEKGELKDEDKKHLSMAKNMGLNVDKILERRPDWAKAADKNIRDVIRKMEPEDFRKNVQKEALENPEVIYHLMLDEMKFREMEQKGKAEKKLKIKETFQRDIGFDEKKLPPEHRQLLRDRAARLSLNRSWFPTKQEQTDEKRESKVILPKTEEFRKTEEEIRRRTK